MDLSTQTARLRQTPLLPLTGRPQASYQIARVDL